MGDFKDLKAWQHARRLAILSKAAIARLPEAILDLVAALDYLRSEDLAQIHAARQECARTVYGLLRRLPDGPRQPGR